jgi:hypothetical protein
MLHQLHLYPYLNFHITLDVVSLYFRLHYLATPFSKTSNLGKKASFSLDLQHPNTHEQHQYNQAPSGGKRSLITTSYEMKSTQNIEQKKDSHLYLRKLMSDRYNSKFSSSCHKIRPNANKLNGHGTFIRNKKRAKLNTLVNILFHTKSAKDELFS